MTFPLTFDNHFSKLGEKFFSRITPAPLENSFIAAYSENACELLDLDPQEFSNQEFCDFLTAKKLHPKACNLAMLYAGHQFGHFVPQLGDGRAALLAQIKNKKNESWDVVLKGSGLTPYSRMGDGKAVLRSSIREFLISEAMHHLGIPTTRALCLIASEQKVFRDGMEKAAQIIRLSPSHIRFGSFEVFFYRKEFEQIKILADYAISHHPELASGSNQYANFLQNVVTATAKLIAKWQAFGFCHGVLNTDNMSILGITLDYGPFGFLDEYNPHHICNHSDYEGRYSFINQPAIGLWNLHAFAITLSHLVSMAEQKEILASYEKIFHAEYYDLMARKLGFERADDDTKKLTHEILDLLEQHKIDYTIFFRSLGRDESWMNSRDPRIASDSRMTGWLERMTGWLDWLKNYQETLNARGISEKMRVDLIKNSNPKFILRNHLLQSAIEKADLENDFSEVEKLQKIMQKPFAEQKENEAYADLPPAWAKEICISCSS